MKKQLKYWVGFVLIILFSIHTTYAQTSEVSAQVIQAFKSGSADVVANHFNDNVELVLPKTNNFYTKQQAKSVLADFFRKNAVKNFTVIHKGTKENMAFLIGSLVTSNGNFRVSIFVRKSGNFSLINQLRIE